MAPVADAIRRHGIVLLDARSIGATVAARTVEEAGGKALSNDMFVDGEPTRRAIRTALDRLIRQAKARGHALGIARGLPVTLDLLPARGAKLEERGVASVPHAADWKSGVYGKRSAGSVGSVVRSRLTLNNVVDSIRNLSSLYIL